MVRILRLLIKTQVRGASWRNRDSWVTQEPPAPPDRRELLGLRERKVRRDSWVTREPPALPDRRELLVLQVLRVHRDSWVIREQLGPPDHRELPDLRERKDPLGLRVQSRWEQ